MAWLVLGRAAAGRQLWARSYHGPRLGDTSSAAVAVSPGGSRVFVTGDVIVAYCG